MIQSVFANLGGGIDTQLYHHDFAKTNYLLDLCREHCYDHGRTEKAEPGSNGYTDDW